MENETRKEVNATDKGFEDEFAEAKLNMKKEDLMPTEEQKNPMRQIIIETDGSGINLVKAEVAGNIELTAILQAMIQFINRPNK